MQLVIHKPATYKDFSLYSLTLGFKPLIIYRFINKLKYSDNINDTIRLCTVNEPANHEKL